uniref:Uncharacterized protein n=1 Tax=Steinernema glaseri TaxID=37863 RepID=A0A1I7Y002_9BILA
MAGLITVTNLPDPDGLLGGSDEIENLLSKGTRKSGDESTQILDSKNPKSSTWLHPASLPSASLGQRLVRSLPRNKALVGLPVKIAADYKSLKYTAWTRSKRLIKALIRGYNLQQTQQNLKTLTDHKSSTWSHTASLPSPSLGQRLVRSLPRNKALETDGWACQ